MLFIVAKDNKILVPLYLDDWVFCLLICFLTRYNPAFGPSHVLLTGYNLSLFILYKSLSLSLVKCDSFGIITSPLLSFPFVSLSQELLSFFWEY